MDIIVGGPLKPNGQNVPTRVGEIVSDYAELANIPNPRVGMEVWVEKEKIAVRILTLKEATIAGVVVPNAVVDEWEVVPNRTMTTSLANKISNEELRATLAEGALQDKVADFENNYFAKMGELDTKVESLHSEDANLQSNINEIQLDLQSKINSEVDRAGQAETYLLERIGLLEGVDTGKSVRAIATELIAKVVSNAPEDLDTLKEIADFITNDKTGAAYINAALNTHTTDIKGLKSSAVDANSFEVEPLTDGIGVNFSNIDGTQGDSFEIPAATAERAGVMSAEDKKEQVKKTPLVNGEIIVGQAREVYSRQGKIDSATFLKRTTAGGTSVSDGVASVKQIGGNIVKNLADGVLLSGLSATGGTITVENGIVVFSSSSTEGKGSLRNYKTPTQTEVVGHKYYQACLLKCSENPNEKVFVGWGALANAFPAGHAAIAQSHTDWQWISVLYSSFGTGNYHSVVVGDKRTSDWGKIYVKNYLHIDLTEMFGAGNEPTKEECDALFSTIGALPKGLTIAQPTGLKSTGYNQWNPENVLIDKTITDNAIVDGDKNIAIVECLPCEVGAGENNGYVIGYGEGDSWSDDGIEVYLSPLNPMEIEGELFMHKLEKDTDYGTYVPQIKGYLLVVTPTTDKLCAHFAWSGDRAKTDYEEYTESNIAIPSIPSMSEWGLAGISTSGTLAADTIDLDRMVYTKRIGRIDMGTMAWSMTTVKTPDEKSTYSMFQSYTLNGKFLKPAVGKTANGMVYGYTPMPSRTVATQEMTNRSIMLYDTGYLYIRDDAYTSADAFKAAMQGVMLYFELATPEEYPIVTKATPNYIGSDYGVEEFTGTKIPLAANILFYMRSLVGETRNFLDRLMARLGTSDATAVADKIADAILPQDATTEGADVEPTEVIEE